MSGSAVASYESRLSSDLRWALSESSLFFEGSGAVQESLRRVVSRLDELGIPYAVAGGMALFAHGYRRFTEDVDILIRPEDLQRIHSDMTGLGYVSPFESSRNLRDVYSQVRIEFRLAGAFPGDGKPKPVAFPDPATSAVELAGVRFLGLKELVELKLASGMTAAHRLRDLADVMELIRLLGLGPEFAADLSPYVRGKFDELREAVQGGESIND